MRSLLLLSVLGLWAPAVLAAPGDTLYVRGNNVNVRAQPSLDAVVLRQVHYGHLVIELQRRDNWIQVYLTRGRVHSGWIHHSLLALVPYRNGHMRRQDTGSRRMENGR